VPDDDPLKDWPDAKALLLRFGDEVEAEEGGLRPRVQDEEAQPAAPARSDPRPRIGGPTLAEAALWLLAGASAAAAILLSG